VASLPVTSGQQINQIYRIFTRTATVMSLFKARFLKLLVATYP
jgi:hypothetical protein